MSDYADRLAEALKRHTQYELQDWEMPIIEAARTLLRLIDGVECPGRVPDRELVKVMARAMANRPGAVFDGTLSGIKKAAQRDIRAALQALADYLTEDTE